jgi:hypothetical protein
VGEEQIELLVTFYKALADESRLKILGLLAAREHSVEELAAILGLREPTVSHHLGKLRRDLSLVRMRAEGTTHLYSLNVEALRGLQRAQPTPERLASLVDDLEAEAWERKVLRDFFEGERLKEIPASRKKRLVVLRWLAGRFEHGRRYPEVEVNTLIKRHHPDPATLRREMIAAGLMQREAGVYWRPDAPVSVAVPEGGAV